MGLLASTTFPLHKQTYFHMSQTEQLIQFCEITTKINNKWILCMCDRASYMKMMRDTNLMQQFFFFSPGATTPIGGCILQPSSGL